MQTPRSAVPLQVTLVRKRELHLADLHLPDGRYGGWNLPAVIATLVARAFRGQVLAQGLRHLAPERVLELAEGDSEGATGEEREHLAQCPTCRGELEWARSQAPLEAHLAEAEGPRSVSAGERTTRRTPHRRLMWRWALAGAGVALAAVVIVMLVPTGHAPPPIPPPGAPPTPSPPPRVEPAGRLASLATVAPLPAGLPVGRCRRGRSRRPPCGGSRHTGTHSTIRPWCTFRGRWR